MGIEWRAAGHGTRGRHNDERLAVRVLLQEVPLKGVRVIHLPYRLHGATVERDSCNAAGSNPSTGTGSSPDSTTDRARSDAWPVG